MSPDGAPASRRGPGGTVLLLLLALFLLAPAAAPALDAPAGGGGPAPDPDRAPASVTPPRWEPVAPGIEFSRVVALRGCRGGSPGVAVVRLDPARCRIEPFHEDEYPDRPRAGIDAWRERLEAPVVLNAGLYDPGRRHLGTLRRDGRDLGGIAHRSWKGMLAAGADEDGLPPAALLDLAVPAERARAARYPDAVQSMMLFDRTGALRVRDTDRAAPRSLVAAGADGRLYVVITEGDFTLAGAAALLRDAGWGITAALALDGGDEAVLAVEGGGVQYRSYLGVGEGDPASRIRRAATTLPAVLAVWPSEVPPGGGSEKP